MRGLIRPNPPQPLRGCAVGVEKAGNRIGSPLWIRTQKQKALIEQAYYDSRDHGNRGLTGAHPATVSIRRFRGLYGCPNFEKSNRWEKAMLIANDPLGGISE